MLTNLIRIHSLMCVGDEVSSYCYQLSMSVLICLDWILAYIVSLSTIVSEFSIWTSFLWYSSDIESYKRIWGWLKPGFRVFQFYVWRSLWRSSKICWYFWTGFWLTLSPCQLYWMSTQVLFLWYSMRRWRRDTANEYEDGSKWSS